MIKSGKKESDKQFHQQWIISFQLKKLAAWVLESPVERTHIHPHARMLGIVQIYCWEAPNLCLAKTKPHHPEGSWTKKNPSSKNSKHMIETVQKGNMYYKLENKLITKETPKLKPRTQPLNRWQERNRHIFHIIPTLNSKCSIQSDFCGGVVFFLLGGVWVLHIHSIGVGHCGMHRNQP